MHNISCFNGILHIQNSSHGNHAGPIAFRIKWNETSNTFWTRFFVGLISPLTTLAWSLHRRRFRMCGRRRFTKNKDKGPLILAFRNMIHNKPSPFVPIMPITRVVLAFKIFLFINLSYTCKNGTDFHNPSRE